MLNKSLLTVLGAAAIVAGFANSAAAFTFTESGDAGETLETAQEVGAGVTAIAGRISLDNVDLFSFTWAGGLFGATTEPDSQRTLDDTQLFLFDAAGLGIVANDDTANAPGFRSTITPFQLAAGTYFLGISGYDNDPFSAGGAIFPDTPLSGQLAPTGPGGNQPLVGWDNRFGEAGTYRIALSGPTSAAVPEPMTILGTMLAAGLGVAAKKRNKKA